MKKNIGIGFMAIMGLFSLQACQNASQGDAPENTAATEAERPEDPQLKKAQGFFAALPEAADPNSALAKLGKSLYYETQLSVNNEMSCNTCHQLDNYGVDNEATSLGTDGKSRGDRNSPTVYNAYSHLSQFWDGRAADLTEQAKGPVLNPVEMAMPDENTVVKRLKASEQYQALFKAAFPDQAEPITFQNMAVAIAEFEKTLATPGRWDQYLNGNSNILTMEEKQGMETFINSGCTACHTGAGLGGHMYQKFGLVHSPYWNYTGSTKHDLGREEHTGKESDRYMFKVPALRNISKTGPYFHDGSVADLGEAIKIMAKTQLGRDLSEEDTQSIITFLEALTGEIPEHALAEQALAAR